MFCVFLLLSALSPACLWASTHSVTWGIRTFFINCNLCVFMLLIKIDEIILCFLYPIVHASLIFYFMFCINNVIVLFIIKC